jgi:hypothetical protein
MKYPLDNLEIELGHKTVKIKGHAYYDIENSFARFTSVVIKDWSFICKNEKDAMQGLTQQDIRALKDSILDNLNENYELCDYLAGEYLS